MFKKNYQAVFSKVTASEDTYRRIMNMTNTTKHRRPKGFAGKALIAAIVVTMLAATASAAGFGWFTKFFGGPENLNQEQIRYLEENTQTIPQDSGNGTSAVQEDGYAVSVDSILTDGQVAYITLNITMPEEIESPGEGWTMENGPHIINLWLCPADQQKPTMEEMLRWSWGYRAYDDGDGKDNTCKLILRVTRDGNQALSSMGSQWLLHIGGLEATWRNEEEKARVTGQYAGQDYLIDGEEVTQFLRYETLTDDTWEFTLDLDLGQSGEVEFITQPITLSGYRPATLGEMQEGISNDLVGPFEVRLASLRISPLSYYLRYTAEDDYNAQTVNTGAHTLVMKDGTKIDLFPYNGRHTFSKPIILTEIDYILLSDGTVLSLPE